LSKEPFKPKYKVRIIYEAINNRGVTIQNQMLNLELSEVALQRLLGVQLMKFESMNDMYNSGDNWCIDFNAEYTDGSSKSTFIEYCTTMIEEEPKIIEPPAKNPEYLQKFVDANLLKLRS